MSDRSKTAAVFHSRKYITFLFKWFLGLLEDIKREHEINFKKLKEMSPEKSDLIEMANYMDDSRFKALRKRVLDHGNETIRNLERDLENI